MANSSAASGHRAGRGAKRYGSRYKARRRAMDLLFEAEARDTDPVALTEERATYARLPQSEIAPVADYTREIVAGVAVQLDRLDEVIENYLTDDWELFRLPATDRAILRVAVWELLFNPDVPDATAVVEGTELASQYSGPAASAYVNAMLDRVRLDADVLRLEAPTESADHSSDDELVAAVVGDDEVAGGAGQSPDATVLASGEAQIQEAAAVSGATDLSAAPETANIAGAPGTTEDNPEAAPEEPAASNVGDAPDAADSASGAVLGSALAADDRPAPEQEVGTAVASASAQPAKEPVPGDENPAGADEGQKGHEVNADADELKQEPAPATPTGDSAPENP